MKIIEHFKIQSFDTYWSNYGGLKAIKESPYFKISIIISLIITIFGNNEEWYNIPISILPYFLFFSIGIILVSLIIIDKEFWKFLAEDKKSNTFMSINSSFVHFMFIQMCAILFALLCSILEIDWFLFTFIGYFLLIYGICSVFAAILMVLELTKYYQIFLIDTKEIEKEKKN